jgi:hypothetical protein
MKRYLHSQIIRDLPRKIILLTGPRQCGKTTLAKMLSASYDYFNFDNPEHRMGLIERSWDRSKELVIFDELHKMKKWKSWLKGVYDTESSPPYLIVTGSAKLDTYRKVGDSLAGRFFQFRLHPLDLKELRTVEPSENPDQLLDRLLATGGFPEPYIENSSRFYNRWKRSHIDIIVRQDLLELENVQQITSIETLIQLLRHRVGSPLSYRSLAEDLQCSDKSVKKWLSILEEMYVVFKVTPFHRNIARSILKSPKYYFYDTGQVIGDDGIKLENLTACALLKRIQYREDCYGDSFHLNYLMTKDHREIDFLVTQNEAPSTMLEVKWAGDQLSNNFAVFEKFFPGIRKIQISRHLAREKTYPDNTEIRFAHIYLSNPSL